MVGDISSGSPEAVVDPGFVERGVVRPWDPSRGWVLDQGDVPTKQ